MKSIHSEGTRARSSQGSHAAGTAVSVITGLIASVLALHIFFVIFAANQGNDFVLFINDLAGSLALGMDPLFTPESAKTGVFLNYGFAAVLYMGIGQLVSRLLRRY
ncbi:hypothetical protein ABZW18_06350 [Streptomyces sp. NPDC004647]|uniref:hypothetical protein n=1 Tax=Streptomyces sp. NPDC004647 TaxID=3154671 RepID=UPI0033BB65BA